EGRPAPLRAVPRGGRPDAASLERGEAAGGRPDPGRPRAAGDRVRAHAGQAAPDRRILRLEEPALVRRALLYFGPPGRGFVPQGASFLPGNPGLQIRPGSPQRAQQAVIRRLPLLLALACSSSCGYEVGNLYEIRDV